MQCTQSIMYCNVCNIVKNPTRCRHCSTVKGNAFAVALTAKIYWRKEKRYRCKVTDLNLYACLIRQVNNHVNMKRCHVESNDNVGQSSSSLFSIEPFSLGRLQNNKVVTHLEDSWLSNVDDDCVTKPLNLRRVPWWVLKDIIFVFGSPNCNWYMQGMLWEPLSIKIWKGKLEGVVTKVYVS